MANRIQCNYDSLANIAKTFAQEAEQSSQLMQSVKSIVDQLQNGGWIGLGAERFFEEMNDLMFPAMNRLMNTLRDAGQASSKISQALRQAEEEAGALFRGEGGADGGTGSAPGASGGATGPGGSSGPGGSTGGTGATPGTNAGPAITYPKPAWPVDLSNKAQIDELINPNIKGANDSELANLMYRLSQNPTGSNLDETLRDIAKIRGVPEEKIRSDYQKFLEVRNQAEQNRIAKGLDPIDPLSSGNNPLDPFRAGQTFWGTTEQLRFGKVVGDTFGIDPVFGSLLSPTGGLVGPGDSVLNTALGSVESINIHGAVHDAGGYLYNYHNMGPGYHYVPGTWQILDKGNPLAGQVDGIKFWMNELDKRGR